ncbi:hypothetical protein BLOT_016466 [Blomia tropicalis]|nr:hypothetical protein BLOT_016466 [Blomia tropicalis]
MFASFDITRLGELRMRSNEYNQDEIGQYQFTATIKDDDDDNKTYICDRLFRTRTNDDIDHRRPNDNINYRALNMTLNYY